MNTGPLNVWTIPLCGCVVQRESQPIVLSHEWLDHCDQQLSSDLVCLLADRRDGYITRAELLAQTGGADPTGDGPATASEHRAEKQKDESGSGPRVECGGEKREPLAGFGVAR